MLFRSLLASLLAPKAKILYFSLLTLASTTTQTVSLSNWLIRTLPTKSLLILVTFSYLVRFNLFDGEDYKGNAIAQIKKVLNYFLLHISGSIARNW